jgi:DMSO/TMAO reductase YedYZ molybdopterin-dependent catalytic subunit
VGIAGWSAGWLLDAFRGSERRFTGSRWLAAGGIPPATTFFGEGTPTIDPSAWRLTVRGRVAHPATYDLAAFEALGSERWGAVLDCTSGWAMETEWAGVPTAAILAAAELEPGATRVEVRSVTGWGAGLSLEEAAGTLLATHVAAEPLPAGNGAPCRLVVPDRRGLDWVKWVVDIEVS